MLRGCEITKIPVIHLRHWERSAAIHGCALPTLDRHGLQPRDDEGILVISMSLSRTSRNQTGKDAPRLFAKSLDVQPIYVLANVLGQAE